MAKDIDDILNEQLGSWIRFEMKRKGITLDEMSFLTDIEKERMSSILKGTQDPSIMPEEIVKIAEVLNVPVKLIQKINNELIQ